MFKHQEGFMGHQCELIETVAQDEFLYVDPRANWFPRLVRRLRLKCLVSRSHLYTKKVLPSTAAVNFELARHIRSYPYTIHPFSEFRCLPQRSILYFNLSYLSQAVITLKVITGGVYIPPKSPLQKYKDRAEHHVTKSLLYWFIWEIFMMVVLVMLLFMIPFYISFNTGRLRPLRDFMLGLDFVCGIDILLNFFTGFFSEKTQEIHLDLHTISRHYLTSFFVVDLISTVPTEMMLYNFDKISHTAAQVTYMMKIFRTGTVMRYMRNTLEQYHVNYIPSRLTQSFFLLALYLHWMGCMHYYVSFVLGTHRSWLLRNNLTVEDVWGKYRVCMFRAVSNTFTVGLGLQMPQDIPDMMWTMVNCLTGAVLIIYTMVQMMVMMRVANTNNAKYEEMTIQLEEFMHYKQIPPPLKKRLTTYYKFCFQKSYFREPHILDSISTQLRQELLLHSCRRLVENVPFFNNIPVNLMIRIVKCLHSEVLLANDVVMKAGTSGDCMYFISSGTVAIYTTSGKEVCHLEDGAHFGEIALVMEDERRVANVVAVETCELYKLTRADFLEAVAPYPHLLKRIEQTARERLQLTLQMDDQGRQWGRALARYQLLYVSCV
ncbi:potassium/sodium hyperpolarization-activated cyclic nucleotide-gated channel 1 [Anabrus simplex]|uniref:potassium/sodium hyperpolarization-activated cyclic nucleotide-gated channel 1 n=1 Tax=Anabrus simplex TaxID=316456 RepID=UPI0035A2F09C